jgi:hypothetical protein
MSKPTLTIAVPCPTCGGTKQTMRLVVGDAGINLVRSMPCPNCTDGTIRQAVSCAGCRYASRYDEFRWTYRCSEIEAGEGAEDSVEVDRDFGCLSWEAKA